MSTTKQLRKSLDAVLMDYIHKFEAAHGCKFEFAVADDLMGVICIKDCYLSINDIVYAVDEKLPVNMIFEWYYARLEASDSGQPSINLRSYSKGLRFEGQE